MSRMKDPKVEKLKERIGKERTGFVVLLGIIDILLFVVMTFLTFVVFLLNLPSGLLLGIAWMIGGVFGSLIVGIVVTKIASIVQRYVFFSKEERIAMNEIYKE